MISLHYTAVCFARVSGSEAELRIVVAGGGQVDDAAGGGNDDGGM